MTYAELIAAITPLDTIGRLKVYERELPTLDATATERADVIERIEFCREKIADWASDHEVLP